jgi:hypothetical protein
METKLDLQHQIKIMAIERRDMREALNQIIKTEHISNAHLIARGVLQKYFDPLDGI